MANIDRGAYMAGRAWALKREAVRERSRGYCERCWDGLQQAVHHMTYEHLGDEPLGDLLAVCRPCHAWLSGKSNFDPAPISADQYVDLPDEAKARKRAWMPDRKFWMAVWGHED